MNANPRHFRVAIERECHPQARSTRDCDSWTLRGAPVSATHAWILRVHISALRGDFEYL